MGVVLARAIIGFVLARDQPGGTDAFLAVVSNASNVAKSVLYVTQTILGDSCMASNLPIV